MIRLSELAMAGPRSLVEESDESAVLAGTARVSQSPKQRRRTRCRVGLERPSDYFEHFLVRHRCPVIADSFWLFFKPAGEQCLEFLPRPLAWRRVVDEMPCEA